VPAAVIRPTFHHVNLKTTRLAKMADWYRTVVGADVLFRSDVIAFLSNDEANHRIALLAFPGFTDDPAKETHTGLHHTAFEYDSFDDLNASYLRLREAAITPEFCLDHGATFSYYYRDPDGNRVELQCDCFGDWRASSEWVRTSGDLRSNPIGAFFDAERVAAAAASGEPFAEIHRRAAAGEFAPAQAPIDVPAAS
jgi:catechol 2,3-dioxygenase